MKKRALSLILALVLVVGLLPTVAFAAGGNEAEIVGGGQYATLQEAVDAAVDGDTVRVLKDIAFEVPVEKLNCTDRQYYQPVHIIGKEIVLDFAGHTLTWCDGAKNQTTCNKDSWFTFFALGNGANVMITGNPRMETLVKDGMHSSAFWLRKDADATLRIKDGYYYATDNVIFVYVGGGRVLIYGGTFENNSSKYGWSQLLNCAGDNYGHANGPMNDSKRITMHGGTLISADPSRMNDGNLVANGYEVQKNGTAYSVVPTETVAEIVGGNQYATLQDAVDAAVDGDTVRVLKDIVFNSDVIGKNYAGKYCFGVIINGKSITIDLNAHKLSWVRDKGGNATIGLVKAADVTVTGNGVVDGNLDSDDDNFVSGIWLTEDSASKLTVMNGTFYGLEAVYISDNGGTADIYGGRYENSENLSDIWSQILNVRGGHSGLKPENLMPANKKITIYGGTVVNADPRYFNDRQMVPEGYYVSKELVDGKTEYTVAPEYLVLSTYKDELVDGHTSATWRGYNPKEETYAIFMELFDEPTGLVAILDDVPFVDVDFNDYFYDSVKWAYHAGVTGGTDAWHFSPNAGCTRAQAVTFLWRAAGCPSASYLGNFADVDADAYYAPAVAWAVANGVTNGTSATTFSPEAACSRGDIVTFLYRAFGGTSNGYHPFTDVAASAYYADAVAWAYEHNVTGGTSADQFSPAEPCSRAQIVTFLYRVMG